MKKINEDVSIGKLTELYKNSKTDDGTLYSALYDLYILIEISKGINEIKFGNGTPIEEFCVERESFYESYSRKLNQKMS